MDKQHEKKLERLEEESEAKMHIDSLRTTLKRISNWKTSCYDGIRRFWFKKLISIHDRLAIKMNRYLQEADISEWMTKRKTTLIQKDPIKGTAPTTR